LASTFLALRVVTLDFAVRFLIFLKIHSLGGGLFASSRFGVLRSSPAQSMPSREQHVHGTSYDDFGSHVNRSAQMLEQFQRHSRTDVVFFLNHQPSTVNPSRKRVWRRLVN
jgi:hypothetical protein